MKIKYFRLYGSQKKAEKKPRIVTVVYTDNSVGIAICNPNDHFSKRVGRDLATKMLNEKPFIVPQNLNKLDYNEIEVIIFTIIKSNMITYKENVIYNHY